ncbi:MOSC domain-containing protein 3 [Elsinoe fawcettii]|nr:MOSC domain-containing protein 3 [Elsinoe fawcettii]
MRVEKIYAYPVKALRGLELSSAEATRYGLSFDRRYMLVKVLPEGVQNIHVAHFPESVLFSPSVRLSHEDGVDELTITHHAPNRPETSLTFPLFPSIEGLDTVDITMHKTPTKGFDMGPECNDWFSECFGFQVKLLYLGDNRRNVLMSTRSAGVNGAQSWSSWATNVLTGSGKDEITFADCAAYLVTSRTSLLDVSERLPEGEEMDITKFRPNIVISGAEEAWEEDYWSEISIGDVKLDLVHNCVRCKSINIDYTTGKAGEGESGKVLKKLQSDRRVDTGAKWSPVFGRYSFLSRDSAEATISIGDEVKVLRRNAQRTVFDWPGLG